MTLNCASGVQFSFCLKVHLMRFFGRFKRTEISGFPANANISLPIVPISSNAKQTRCRPFLRCSPIFNVQSCRCCAKIYNSIVISAPIYMVNILWRHLSVIMHPRKPVGSMAFAKRKYAEISRMMFAPGKVTNLYSLSNFFAPKEISRFGIVIKNVSNVFNGYSHGYCLLHSANIGDSIA